MQGRILNNKYRLERKIAQGGMSSVYLCTNIELGNKWVAKHIEPKYCSLIYEEEILKRLNHINLPKVIDVIKNDTGLYMIESYIEGSPLQKKLEGLRALPAEKAIHYALQLCEVLIYLHNIRPKAIVHRDLKPSNIIITDYDMLVLIDFGISEELGGKLGRFKAGTNAYAAPEQMIDAGVTDNRSDIYSFGVLFYKMLTGQLPGTPGIANSSGYSPLYNRMFSVCERCTRFRQEERYQKMEEVKQELLEIRDKLIVAKEKEKLRRKLALAAIATLSIVNYLCLIVGIIVNKG